MRTASRALREGVVVGLIAYAAVALFYSAFDFFAARGELHTVNLLGKALFRGLRDPAVLSFPLTLDWTAMFLYNGLHLLVSLVIGVIVVSLADHAERHAPQALLVLLMLAGGGVLTVFAVAYLTEPIRPLLPWWSIVVANALAVVLAGAYLLRRRPVLARRLDPVTLLLRQDEVTVGGERR